jgi:N-acetylmuramoyl-L-alanine amidase
VIKNRAWINKEYWGGSSIKNVCLHPGQFECWNGKSDITITEQRAYEGISEWAPGLLAAPRHKDPTGGADHYNNPTKEEHRSWIDNCDFLRKIGAHHFYKTKKEYL